MAWPSPGRTGELSPARRERVRMQRLLMKVIYVARRLLFRTWLGKTQLVAYVYKVMFEAVAPDLSKPVVFRGVPLYVDPEDRSIVPSIVGGYFERCELDIFEELIRGASTFFDVGANIGVYSVIGATKSRTLTVYAFEPIEENQALLGRNIAEHQLEQRVHVQPVAASDRVGKATIHLHHSGTHSLEDTSSDRTREIATVTLDEFTQRLAVWPDIVKIDVEGHESAVIDGAVKMLAEHRPTVFIEFIPAAHRDVQAFVDRLKSLFTVCFVIDEITSSVTEITTAGLENDQGYNLILTANDEHAALVRRFLVQ
jgi:FkbM family methyltransferase